MRVCDKDRDVLFVQLCCEGFELRGCRNQNQLRAQRYNALDARAQRVADFCDLFGFGRIIAEGCVTDQPVASADGIDNLRQIRRKRDDAQRSGGNAHAPSGIVHDFAHSISRAALRRSLIAPVTRSRERERAEDEQEAEGSCALKFLWRDSKQKARRFHSISRFV